MTPKIHLSMLVYFVDSLVGTGKTQEEADANLLAGYRKVFEGRPGGRGDWAEAMKCKTDEEALKLLEDYWGIRRQAVEAGKCYDFDMGVELL